jgi:hypothetical protein
MDSGETGRRRRRRESWIPVEDADMSVRNRKVFAKQDVGGREGSTLRSQVVCRLSPHRSSPYRSSHIFSLISHLFSLISFLSSLISHFSPIHPAMPPPGFRVTVSDSSAETAWVLTW